MQNLLIINHYQLVFEVSLLMYSILGQGQDIKLEGLSWIHWLLAFITLIFTLKYWFRPVVPKVAVATLWGVVRQLGGGGGWSRDDFQK